MRRFAFVLALFLVAGCGKKPAAPVAGEKTVAPAATVAGAPIPETPAHGARLVGSAPAAGIVPEAPQPALATVSGVVQETLDASDYTYMRLQTSAGEIWAAVTKTSVKKGDRVTVVNAMSMDGFESKTLNRKFEHIVFGNVGGGAAPAPAPVSAHGTASDAPQRAQMAAQHAAAAGGPADIGNVAVPKAEGKEARTVEQVFADRLSLKDKTVSVRGKVVKANSAIMGRNWIHIRDGSGSREKKNDDLTVTTQDGAAVGDVVVVRGVVHLDRDFGAGYSYPVVVEDAKVTREPASTRADATRP
jgi:hypothetical protein